MKLSKNAKCLLLCLLILLTIVLRFPSYPHERGSADEFTIHSVANSVSESGYAKWWMNIYAVFGLYPYSYGSASAFLFSGVSQSAGISMESCAWILCTILGIFIVLSTFIMAEQIRKDDIFMILVTFFISISQGVLTYTTWQVSARGTFLSFLPLMLYVTLKMRNIAVRFSILILILLVFLLSIHHYVYFTIPIIVSFAVVVALSILNNNGIFNNIRVPNMIFSIILVALVIAGFLFPFLTRFLIQGSRYNEIIYLIARSVRYVGVIFPMAIGGVIYLISKRKKEFTDIFLILCLALFSPLMYEETYYPFFGAVLLCIFIGIGVTNIVGISVNKKQIIAIVVIYLLISVSFSAYYQHYRTSTHTHTFYMEESVYNTGLWVKNNLQGENKMVSNDYFAASMILSVSEVPLMTLPFADFVYGFVDLNTDIKVVRNSVLSEAFYRDNPYVLSKEVLNPMYYQDAIQKFSIDSSQGKAIINKKNITHVVESEYFGDNIFINSIHSGEYDEIFNNGKVRIWHIN